MSSICCVKPTRTSTKVSLLTGSVSKFAAGSDVLGSRSVLLEHYRPLSMKAGDSLYYDSGMGHGCISTSGEDARVLWVSLE